MKPENRRNYAADIVEGLLESGCDLSSATELEETVIDILVSLRSFCAEAGLNFRRLEETAQDVFNGLEK